MDAVETVRGCEFAVVRIDLVAVSPDEVGAVGSLRESSKWCSSRIRGVSLVVLSARYVYTELKARQNTCVHRPYLHPDNADVALAVYGYAEDWLRTVCTANVFGALCRT